ncbi:MAG: hypothetical protein ACQEQV_06165 [Fibrobacterota bacterium]
MNTGRTFGKILLSALALAAVATAEVTPLAEERDGQLDSVTKKVDEIAAKAGISFGGSFKTQGFSSVIESDSLIDQAGKKREDIMSTTLDMEINARPLSAVTAKAVLRLHQDWRNMFAASATPLHTRWLSIDGTIRNYFLYNVGDFKTKVSPYTIWSPQPEVLYEPYVFSRNRTEVMNEVFLGDNNRVMQGFNFRVPLRIDPVFRRFDLRVTGSRLQAATGEPEHGPFSPMALEESEMDKYLLHTGLDLTVRDGIGAGFSFLYNSEIPETYKGDGGELTGEYLQDKTTVMAFRGLLGTELIKALDPETFSIHLDGELALSSNRDSAEMVYDSIYDDDGDLDTLIKDSVTDTDVDGLALRIGGDLNAAFDAGQIKLEADVVSNDADFVNEAAQSPVFWKNRVMNTEALSSKDDFMNYNAFNALYRNVYKFMPSGKSSKKLGYTKRPMNKIAWTRAIMSTDSLDKLLGAESYYTLEEYQSGADMGMVDQELSPVMPLGIATPNRLGVTSKLSGAFLDSAVSVTGLFSMFNEITAGTITDTVLFDDMATDYATQMQSVATESDTTEDGGFIFEDLLDKQALMQFGGGLSVDIAGFGTWYDKPLILSGSYVASSIEGTKGMIDRNEDEEVTDVYTKGYTKDVSFLNLGTYLKFYKKAALLGGYQLLTSSNDLAMLDHSLSQWKAGLEFKVLEGGVVTATYGQITNAWDVDSDEYSATSDQFDLLMTVKF